MAGDWIKMRSSLLDHPKVIAITRMLLETRAFRDWLRPGAGSEMNGQIVSQKASRAVTVASLMCTWSNARMHGKFVDEDLHLPFSSIEDLDEFAGVPGIGAAMEKVEWAEKRAGKNGIFLPRFKEFNVPMTEAERARNYRARKTYPQSQHVTRPSRNRRDEKSEIVTTREEKRRTKNLSDASHRAAEPPSDLIEVIFQLGTPMLVEAGVREASARSLLGKLRKVHGDVAVAEAVKRMSAERPSEPAAWLVASLAKHAERAQSGVKSAGEWVNQLLPRKPDERTIDHDGSAERLD